jgi:hypothetical protein
LDDDDTLLGNKKKEGIEMCSRRLLKTIFGIFWLSILSSSTGGGEAAAAAAVTAEEEERERQRVRLLPVASCGLLPALLPAL